MLIFSKKTPQQTSTWQNRAVLWLAWIGVGLVTTSHTASVAHPDQGPHSFAHHVIQPSLIYERFFTSYEQRFFSLQFILISNHRTVGFDCNNHDCCAVEFRTEANMSIKPDPELPPNKYCPSFVAPQPGAIPSINRFSRRRIISKTPVNFLFIWDNRLYQTVVPKRSGRPGHTDSKYSHPRIYPCDVSKPLTSDGCVPASNSDSATLPKPTQSITHSIPSSLTLTDAPLTLNAQSTSGNLVTFNSQSPTVCTTDGPNGTILHMQKVGVCVIEMSAAGNSQYKPATQKISIQITAKDYIFAPPSTPKQVTIPVDMNRFKENCADPQGCTIYLGEKSSANSPSNWSPSSFKFFYTATDGTWRRETSEPVPNFCIPNAPSTNMARGMDANNAADNIWNFNGCFFTDGDKDEIADAFRPDAIQQLGIVNWFNTGKICLLKILD